MKKLVLLYMFFVFAGKAMGQKETFDIVSYVPPSGWTKQITQDIVAYNTVDKKTNAWCQMGIVKSTASKGTIELDFESEWQNLVVKNYKPTEAPQLEEIQESDGWKIRTGIGKFTFNGGEAIVLLTTASGFNRCVSIVATTNGQDFIKEIESLLSSVDLIKPATELPMGNTGNGVSVVGTWGISSTVASSYNMRITEGTIITHYTFNADGTYTFYIKTFRYQLDKLLLTRESGTYKVSGNSITITPKKSVIEAWSKKNGTDQFGELISSDKKDLETVTYQFSSKVMVTGTVLVLQAGKVTKRDGQFNNMDKDAWYYPAMSSIEYIALPGGKAISEVDFVNESAKPASANNSVPFLGTWSKSASARTGQIDPASQGRSDYKKDEYTFLSDNTYMFTSKTFIMSNNKLVLIKEKGTYKVSGSTLTIQPQSSVIQTWTKKDGGDKWGKLISSADRALEKVSYTFTKHYFSGIQQWNFVLQASKPTVRDGPYSNNNTFANAWYFAPISDNNTAITLP